MFWSVPRAETLPCSCSSSVLFSGARCPHLHLFLSRTHPHSRSPTSTPFYASPILGIHLLTPTPACADGLFGPRLCSLFWIAIFPIVLGLWIVIFRIVGPGIVIAASFTDPQSATLTLPTQVGKCGQCHYFEHYSQLNSSARIHNEYCTNITAIN